MISGNTRFWEFLYNEKLKSNNNVLGTENTANNKSIAEMRSKTILGKCCS